MRKLLAPILGLLAAVWALAIRRRVQLPAEIRIVDPEGAPTIDARRRGALGPGGRADDPDRRAARAVVAGDARAPRAYLLALPRALLAGADPRGYREDERAVVLICRPFVLIRFDPPSYELGSDRGVVRWQIRGGALVSHRQNRRGGFLQIDVRRMPSPRDGYQAIHVEVAVLSFYPAIANALWPRALRDDAGGDPRAGSRTASCARWRGWTSRSRGPGASARASRARQ